MFDLEEQIKVWRQQMLAAGIKSPVPLDELEIHLRERIGCLKPDLCEEDAFHTAARELGNAKVLKREFSKGKVLRFLRKCRNNPVTLNILAGWFVLNGLNAMLQLAWLWQNHIFPRTTEYNSVRYYVSFVLAIFSLQFVIGIGLFRQGNFWRYCALAFCSISVVFACWGLAGGSPLTFGTWKSTVLCIMAFGLGVYVPANFLLLMDLLNLGMLLWGIYVLAKPSPRDLFRPTTTD